MQGCNQRLFSLSINHSVIFSISWLVHKMSENGEKYWSLFPKASSNVLFRPQAKDIQFTVTED